MTKKRFLTLTAIVTFLFALMTLEVFCYDFSSAGYTLMGIFCIIDFLLLMLAIGYCYFTEKIFVLSLSTLLSTILIIVLQLHNFTWVVLFALIPPAFSFLALFLLKRQGDPFFISNKCFIAIYTFLSFFFLQNLVDGYIVDYFVICLVTIISLLSFFFSLFKKNVQKIGLSVLFGILSVGAIVYIIMTFMDDETYLQCTAIIIILFTVAYFLINFSSFGKKFLLAFEKKDEKNDEEKDILSGPMLNDTSLDKLEDLQKLHEAGILTDEEYQAQKDKILGGKL